MLNISSRNKLLLDIWYKDPAIFFKDLYGQDPFPYQAKVLRAIKDLNRVLILAGAGTGKSKLLSAIALWLAIVYSYKLGKPYNVIILAGSLEQSRTLYEYSSEAIIDHPIFREFISGDVLRTLCKFITGSIVRALPHSLKSIQGKHAECVLIDEAALVENFTIRDTYRIIAGTDNNKLVFSGTPMIYDTLFVEMWENTTVYKEWTRFSWSTMECPIITNEMIEEARSHLTEDQFTIFWLGKPYPITNTVVPVHLIRRQSIGYEEFSYDPKYKEGKIIMGVDWGMTDRSVLVTTQLIEDQYRILDIAEWRGQQYDNVHDWILAYAERYKPDRIMVDLNPKGESERCKFKLHPKGYYVEAVNLGSERGRLQVRLKYLFEKSKIIIPATEKFLPLLNELKRYTWNKIKGEDRVTALMLAIREIEFRERPRLYYKIARPKRSRISINLYK